MFDTISPRTLTRLAKDAPRALDGTQAFVTLTQRDGRVLEHTATLRYRDEQIVAFLARKQQYVTRDGEHLDAIALTGHTPGVHVDGAHHALVSIAVEADATAAA